MFFQLISFIYRILALTIALIPITLNVIFIGDIKTSLVYVPLLTLILTATFIFFDNKLNKLLLTLQLQLSKGQKLLRINKAGNISKFINEEVSGVSN